MSFGSFFKQALNFVPVVGPLINAGMDIFGGIKSNEAQKEANSANLKAVRETNQANRELAQYNWEQQQEMWNKNNAYNSPIMQMARLKQAGLNPNLVYGNGVTGNTSSSIPTPQLPTQEAGKVAPLDYSYIGQSSQSAFNSYLQQKQLDSQVSLNKAQESAIDSQNLERNQKIAESIMRTAKGWFDYDIGKKIEDYTVEAAALNVSNLKQKFETERYKYTELLPLEKEKMQLTNRLMEANHNLSVKQADKITAEIWKISQEIANFAVQRGLWQSQTRLNNSNADRTELGTSFEEATFNNRVASLAQDLTNAVRTGNLKQLEVTWKQKYGFSSDQVSQIANSFGFQIDSTINWFKSFF